MAIISADNIASEDLLGRKKFAKQIVNSITKAFVEHKESFVIGINGPWGSGKSTLLSFIEQELRETYQQNSDKYKIIHFNPWANTTIDQGELERDFLEVIITELQSIKWMKGTEEKIDKFNSYLKYLNYVKFIKHVHPVAEKIMDVIDDYTNQASTHTLAEVKKQADDLISQKGIKIYIFLDDLDRLSSLEIAAIFRIIKLNVNFVNTCFVVAYDKAVVASSLDEMFNQRGEEYLEKIIQADFSIPEITDEGMEGIFLEKLNSLLSSLQIEFDEDVIAKVWDFYGLKEYFRTVRDIKRFINSMLFSLPNIAEDINVTDYILLESIKVFDYSAYQKLYNDFLVIRRKATWEASIFDQGAIDCYSNVTTRSLLQYLFIEKDIKRQLLGNDSNSKNLRDPEYFERYYTLYISSKDVSQETLEQFLTIGRNWDQILEEALQNGKINNLLKRLSDKDLAKSYSINDVNLLDSFLRFWDRNAKVIDYDLYDYLLRSYFNLAFICKDKFEGAKTAVKNLALRENEQQPIRFIFNYFIALYKSKDLLSNKLEEGIAEQVELYFSSLQVAFGKHIIKHWDSYLWDVIRGVSPLVGRIFIISMAKFTPGEYKKALDKFMEESKFISFLIKEWFIDFDKNKTPVGIDLSNKDLLLPGEYWKKFVSIMTDFKKGTWSHDDRTCFAFFFSSLPYELTGNINWDK